MIEKKELEYIAGAGIFAFVFFTLLVPYILKHGYDKLSSYYQFFIFNIVIFVFLQIYLKSRALDTKFNIWESIDYILVFIALDILLPPIMLSLGGQLSTEPLLSASASDYFFATIGMNLGIKGFFLYLWTYLVVPIGILLIDALLYKNFVRKI